MRWISLALVPLVFACWGGGEEPPGELVGSFEAVGLMVEHSCGSVVPAADPLNVRFNLRTESNGRVYWQKSDGSLLAGVERDDKYSFQISQSWMVIEPDRFRGYVGCSVTQRDVFTFELSTPELETDTNADAGVDDSDVDGGIEDDAGVDALFDPSLTTIAGSQTTEIEALAGSDCTPAVAAVGGPFLSLPCRVEYVINGNGVSTD